MKAVHALTKGEVSLDLEIILALKQILKQEQSPGIKLNALKILQSVYPNQEIKSILMNVLLHDSNPAVRIEAFQAYINSIDSSDEAAELLETVQSDSIDYIHYRAKKVLRKFENSNSYDNNSL